MAKELFRTPLCEARWAKLITARPQLDPNKPHAWTCDLLLHNDDKTAQSFLLAMEDQFVAAHGTKKRRSEKGFPWKADKEKPNELTILRFKRTQGTYKNGEQVAPPRIVDAKKQPWDGSEIGNGSKLIIAFSLYPWDGEQGCGITLQPEAVQVVEFVPYVAADPTADFDEVEGGYSVSGAPAGRSWAFDDEEPAF